MTVSENIVVSGASGQLGWLVIADLLRIVTEACGIGIVRNSQSVAAALAQGPSIA